MVFLSYPRLGVTNCSYSIINPNRNIEGNYLLHVFPNSPAEIAGLKKGDTITKVNNYVVPTYKDFVINISKYQDTTDPIYIEFMREEKTKKVKVNLSQSEIFTAQINIHETTIEEIQEKRRQLAKQRFASGELWKVDRND
ncbi:PDZ domain-containing protein [Virgibacillus proomii]|uniref:PDZ domain-containing protein n=1 Tax=Virgibacillus proomii TaxID=84407 RepID=UPI001C115EF5|nr:PDZ domain-containing protein [Virgibacillus proomii]